MAVDAAFLELRAELVRLRELLRAVRREARRKCPDRGHCVPTRIYDSGPELSGLLRTALAAVRVGVLAAGGDGGSVPRAMLTRCDQTMRKFRRAFRAHLAGPDRLDDLKDLTAREDLAASGRELWAAWAARVEEAVRVARRQSGVATRAVGACWRELAAAPPGGVTITNTNTNTAVGKQVVRQRGTNSGRRAGRGGSHGHR
jgi:hypothetical protein